MSRYYNYQLADHFGIKKIQEFVAQKYYWPTFYHEMKDYLKGYNVCLALKAVQHKPYSDLQSLPVFTHY